MRDPDFVSVLFLILAMIAFSRLEREQRLAQKWIAGAVLLATALNIYELFNPMTFSTIPGRSSGLLHQCQPERRRPRARPDPQLSTSFLTASRWPMSGSRRSVLFLRSPARR